MRHLKILIQKRCSTKYKYKHRNRKPRDINTIVTLDNSADENLAIKAANDGYLAIKKIYDQPRMKMKAWSLTPAGKALIQDEFHNP